MSLSLSPSCLCIYLLGLCIMIFGIKLHWLGVFSMYFICSSLHSPLSFFSSFIWFARAVVVQWDPLCGCSASAAVSGDPCLLRLLQEDFLQFLLFSPHSSVRNYLRAETKIISDNLQDLIVYHLESSSSKNIVW